MSDHTSRSKSASGNHRIVYVDTSALPEREISREEALRSDSYLIRHYVDDNLDHVARVRDGNVRRVIYHARTWPDAELVRLHRKNYGSIPFEIFTSPEFQDGAFLRNVFEIDSSGRLAGRNEHIINSEGDLLSETRMTADGKTLQRFEYVYDDTGELVLTRAFGPDGELYDEIESNDD